MQKFKGSVIYDLIGVGFGPSNLALAIALEERKKNNRALDVLFLDKQPDYRWHGDTITAQSELQVSFLKDLVTLRDPTSPYSFIHYLQKQGRLLDFINLGTFYPSRLEFNNYLCWVAKHFSHQSRYGQEVLSVEPVLTQGRVKTLRVLSRDASGNDSVQETKSLVVSAGGTPYIPDIFRSFKEDRRIFHHMQYLSAMAAQADLSTKPMRIAVVGAGQSAAEAFIDLNDNYASAQVDLITREFSLKPADSSPFVNEIFSPDVTDLVFQKSHSERQKFLKEYRHTNYSVVDMPMIEQIYNIFYQQKVSGNTRHRFLNFSFVEKVETTNENIELQIQNENTGIKNAYRYDMVILATGYKRQKHLDLLEPLSDYMEGCEVGRNYQVQTNEQFHVPVYLQGYCEPSHGLSDTLLSVLAIRSDEIAASLCAALDSIKSMETPDDALCL